MFKSRLWAIVAALTLLLISECTSAETIRLRCGWKVLQVGTGAIAIDPTTADAAAFYGPESPIQFSIDLENSKFTFESDTDKIILRFGSVIVLDEEIKVTFDRPRIKGIVDANAFLDMRIDRYDLSSTLILGFIEAGKGAVGKWVRRGNCQRRQF